MDNSDNTSEHSSDSSTNFLDLVTYAAAFGGYAAGLASAVPVQPAGFGVQEQNGVQWVQNTLVDAAKCRTNFRMSPEAFFQVHNILVSNHGLQVTQDFDTIEGLGMFLWVVRTQQAQRDMADRFRRGLGIAGTASFADTVLRPKDAQYRTVHERLLKYTPFFDGCIGAIDETHVKVSVDRTAHDDFTNRKGWTSQNMVAVCDFDMHFNYVGVGMAGAVHDMAVLRQAWATPNFPHPPAGRYYLVDSGYTGEPGYLGPYRRNRYHLQQFRDRRPDRVEEVFNYHHSSLRNVIERAFGVVKARWKILKEVPHYPRRKQSKIILACFELHNYLVDMKAPGPVQVVTQYSVQWVSANASDDMGTVRQWITLGLEMLGHR